MDIYEELVRLRREGRPCALVTIVQSIGSSPQKEGAKMIVMDDGSTIGTLGGGCIEAEVIQTSLMALREGSARTVPFQLTEKHGGLVCGGKILVYVEPVVPEPHLVVLGAGHVGKALSQIARFSGFRVTVVDDRGEYANRANLPAANEVVVAGFTTVFAEVPADKDTFIVIATRGHNHDLDALRAALMTEARYVGLLGSKRKKALLFKTLRGEGFSDDAIGRVVTPVGLSIGSVTPEEIAISIMAQIIQHRRGHASLRVSDSSCSRLIEEDGADETTPSSRKQAGDTSLS